MVTFWYTPLTIWYAAGFVLRFTLALVALVLRRLCGLEDK